MQHVSTDRKRRSRAEMQEETRRSLLDAALELFIESGVEATSIEQVTARAGYTRGAFYSNFSSKEELFVETSRHFFDQLFEVSAQGDPDDGGVASDARHRITNLRDFAGNAASIYIAEMCLYGYRHPEVRDEIGRVHAEQLQEPIDYLERLIRTAGYQPEDLPVEMPVLAQLMQAAVFALHLVELVDDNALRADDGAATMATLLMRALG